jgi:hypothetical protein
MTPKTIHQYFKELDRRLNADAVIILVGASAGSLMGHVRPSLDIDFEIRLKKRLKSVLDTLDESVKAAARMVGVAVNYSENISHWSMVNFLDYRKTAVYYRQIGKLKIYLIAPEYWTIGKMTRYLELDIRDILKIVRKKKLKPGSLVKLWKKAMRTSQLSLELGQFKDHVHHFLKAYGKRAWGKNFDAVKYSKYFMDS